MKTLLIKGRVDVCVGVVIRSLRVSANSCMLAKRSDGSLARACITSVSRPGLTVLRSSRGEESVRFLPCVLMIGAIPVNNR